jgi:hypothetical protein
LIFLGWVFHLTKREVDLVLKYAFPFPEEAELLRASKPEEGWHVVHIDACWLSLWIGDLVYSAKKIRSQNLLDELDALCSVLENAERHDTRIRGVVIE